MSVPAERAEALLGHPASYFIARSLVWSAVLLLGFGSVAVARYAATGSPTWWA